VLLKSGLKKTSIAADTEVFISAPKKRRGAIPFHGLITDYFKHIQNWFSTQNIYLFLYPYEYNLEDVPN
jgi:hypothetical protein